MRRAIIGVLALAVLATPAALVAQDGPISIDGIPAQPPRVTPPPRLIPVGTATISGVVVSSDTGRPVRNALVSLTGTAGPPRGDGGGGAIPRPAVYPPLPNDNIGVSRATTTNAQGRFTFDRLASGRYSVQTTRDGYLTGGWAQKRVGGPAGSVLLAEGQRLTLSIPLARGGVITGQVLDEDGEPVRGVQVQAWRSAVTSGVRQFRPNANATSDDRGIYRLFGLEPGDYRVAAVPRNSQPTTELRALTDTAAIEAAIAKGAVTTGAAPGYPSYVTVQVGNAPVTAASTFVPVFAPSTTVASDATTIHVDPNAEQGPFLIHLQYVPTANIHGIVSPAPSANTRTQVILVALDGVSSPVSTAVTSPASGEFTLRNVAPGRYRVLAQTTATGRPATEGLVVTNTSSASQPSLWASEDVQVQGQDLEIALGLRPSRTISGIVISEGSAPRPQVLRQVQLVTPPGVPNIFGSNQATIEADGRFTFTNVAPGKYMLRVPGTVKSAMVEGEDSLDVPFDFTGDRDISDAVVTMMDASKRTDLWGTVTDASGKAVADVTIVVAPLDERFWMPNTRRIAMMRTDPWGRFQTRTLPPGTYAVVPIGELENGGQYESELLRTVTTKGSRVTLTEAGSTRQDFHVR